jgi:Tol biopolymer transport system component
MEEGTPPQSDLHVMSAEGGNEVVVAGHPAEDELIGWTPDGRSLIFLSDRSGTWDIWRVFIAGGKQQGEPEPLKKDFGRDPSVVGLAPDGSLYYETATPIGHLYNGELDLETGKLLTPPKPVMTRYTGLTAQLSWSPDGRNLAYLSRPGEIRPGNQILTIRSAETGEERFLSPRLRGVNQISWAPDSRAIIALGFTVTGYGAFRIDIETSAITKLAEQGVFARLCPDGKTLVFFDGEGTIRKRDLGTGDESKVWAGNPSYDISPDGREGVFQADGVVKIASLNGGETREIFRGKSGSFFGLMWTRDGRNIIVRGRGTENNEIWRVPAQGGTPFKLDISFPRMINFALHPNNRRFVFSDSEKIKSELWVLENLLPPTKAAK